METPAKLAGKAIDVLVSLVNDHNERHTHGRGCACPVWKGAAQLMIDLRLSCHFDNTDRGIRIYERVPRDTGLTRRPKKA